MKPNIGISDKNRKTVSVVLANLLADEVALYVATRGAHWNVVGPNFGALHGFFESQYEALDDILDDVAERMRSLGSKAPSTVGAYAKAKSIDDTAGEAASAVSSIDFAFAYAATVDGALLPSERMRSATSSRMSSSASYWLSKKPCSAPEFGPTTFQCAPRVAT